MAHRTARAAARSLVPAGVLRATMKPRGWKTDAMLRRYPIVDRTLGAGSLLAKEPTGRQWLRSCGGETRTALWQALSLMRSSS